jgi:hypothetical protein
MDNPISVQRDVKRKRKASGMEFDDPSAEPPVFGLEALGLTPELAQFPRFHASKKEALPTSKAPDHSE